MQHACGAHSNIVAKGVLRRVSSTIGRSGMIGHAQKCSCGVIVVVDGLAMAGGLEHVGAPTTSGAAIEVFVAAADKRKPPRHTHTAVWCQHNAQPAGAAVNLVVLEKPRARASQCVEICLRGRGRPAVERAQPCFW